MTLARSAESVPNRPRPAAWISSEEKVARAGLGSGGGKAAMAAVTSAGGLIEVCQGAAGCGIQLEDVAHAGIVRQRGEVGHASA